MEKKITVTNTNIDEKMTRAHTAKGEREPRREADHPYYPS